MKWWEKKYQKVAEAKTKAANKIVFFIGRAKTACARYLDKKINPLPVAKKRMLFYLFCIVSALYCLLLLLSPFRAVKNAVAVKVESMPLLQPPSTAKQPRVGELIPSEQYNRIHAFKLYLDSLEKDTTGKRLFDSIVRTHPGIKDSLRQIEDYYQLQNNK